MRVVGGQADPDDRPPSGRTLGDDRAAMSVGDLPDDREAEPRARHPAGAAGAVEAVEDMRQIGLRDPRSVISHLEFTVARYPNLDRLAGRAPLDRVVEQ